MLSIGQIVYSKRGRDKGNLFIVVGLYDNYCLIADGGLRKIESPKKKKLKHIQPTNNFAEAISDNESFSKIKNSDLKHALLNFKVRGFSLVEK